MDKVYWLNKWQKNDIAFNQQAPNNLLVSYFNDLQLKRNSRILVPLCGKSVDMLWLYQQGYKILGIELSEIACRDFFTENALIYTSQDATAHKIFRHQNIQLIAGDFFLSERASLLSIQAVYDRAALIALPQELRKRYVAHLLSLLEPNTPILLIATDYDSSEMQGPPYPLGKKSIQNLFATCNIETLYYRPMKRIPEHLKQKGLTDAIEQAYCITTPKQHIKP